VLLCVSLASAACGGPLRGPADAAYADAIGHEQGVDDTHDSEVRDASSDTIVEGSTLTTPACTEICSAVGLRCNPLHDWLGGIVVGGANAEYTNQCSQVFRCDQPPFLTVMCIGGQEMLLKYRCACS